MQRFPALCLLHELLAKSVVCFTIKCRLLINKPIEHPPHMGALVGAFLIKSLNESFLGGSMLIVSVNGALSKETVFLAASFLSSAAQCRVSFVAARKAKCLRKKQKEGTFPLTFHL